MLIQILCDNPSSWIIPYAEGLKDILTQKGHHVLLIFDSEKVMQGDILVLLSCEKIFKKLDLNKHSLVVHESALPKGKGWSPLTWQVLEGKNEIPITLFEASEKVDAGVIYYQEAIQLQGHELVDELREAQGKATIDLVARFIDSYPNVKGTPQIGESTYYEKRKPEHSQLDPDKSIREQFNLLRVADNERYPAFFEINGIKYKVAISKMDN